MEEYFTAAKENKIMNLVMLRNVALRQFPGSAHIDSSTKSCVTDEADSVEETNANEATNDEDQSTANELPASISSLVPIEASVPSHRGAAEI